MQLKVETLLQELNSALGDKWQECPEDVLMRSINRAMEPEFMRPGGAWEEIKERGGPMLACTFCGAEYRKDYIEYFYRVENSHFMHCPHCGTRNVL